MKRFLPTLAVFLLALTASLIVGHFLGDRVGESVARRRHAEASSASAAPAGVPPPASLSGTISTTGPRSREAIRRFLDEIRDRVLLGSATDPALADTLATLSPDEVRLALDLILEKPPGVDRVRLAMALLSRWAKEDPAAALAFVKDRRDEAGTFASLWLTAVFHPWADRDPLAAARAMASTLQPDDDDIVTGSIGNTVFMVAEKLAQADLAAGMANVAALPGWAQDSARTAVAKQVHGAGRQPFLDAILALPDGPEKAAWQHAAAVALAPVDGTAAAKWIDSLGLSPAEVDKADRAVFTKWKDHDPRAATAWAMARLPEAERAGLVEEAVEGWAAREPNECGRWLGELGADPLYDPAVRSFARQIAAKDRESARIWAGRITDAALRAQCLAELGGAE